MVRNRPSKKIWTVPANRMKAGREDRVFLSPRAVAILRKLEKLKTGEFVSPAKLATSRRSSQIVPTTARNSAAGSTTEPAYVLFGQIFDLL
jgi:integrase